MREPYSRVFGLISSGDDLASVLSNIAQILEAEVPESWCAVYLVQGSLLECVAAPSCPEFQHLFNSVAYPADRISDFITPDLGPRAFRSCITEQITAGETSLGILALQCESSIEIMNEWKAAAAFAATIAAIAISHHRLREQLESHARYDPLTGLPNRTFFLERLQNVLRAAPHSQALGVLFIDLDRFKQVNDTLGHAVGDRLLQEVGARLQKNLQPGDIAGRMGGDEFTLLLTQRPDDKSIIRATRALLNALRIPYWVDEHQLTVTASIGVSLYPAHAQDAEDLLRNADMAMYTVKRRGKNDVQVFEPEKDLRWLDRLPLESALRNALNNSELELLYQPVMTVNGVLDGFEALLAWHHPVRGTIRAEEFVPLAEETRLIVPIGAWVIYEACSQAIRWLRAGYRNAKISVNVSAFQFERDDFVDNIASTLQSVGLPPHYLVLEVTESVLMRDMAVSAQRMADLRELGVSIAIDDFGTGYSSLSYLSRLPADSLKIDQSFTRNLHDVSGSLPVIQTIVRLAHSLNLTVVAEGVERLEELNSLRVLGCDKVQGHLYGPALTAHDAEALFARPSSSDEN